MLPQLYKINHLSVLLKNMGGSKKTTFEPISVTKLIHNVKPLVNLSNDVSFCVDVSEVIEDDVMILANQILLEQMLLNLSLNSVDALQNTMDPEIIFKVYSIGVSKVVIEVIDNGVGISDLDKKQLFDPFFTTKDSGTGLGLSIVFKLFLIIGDELMF